MGHLFTRMATVSNEQQTSNRLKRKRIDSDDPPNKRKIVNNERLILSPRISSSMELFRCQLCRRFLKTKDHYMDHMTNCSIEHQVSIKVIRSVKDSDEN